MMPSYTYRRGQPRPTLVLSLSPRVFHQITEHLGSSALLALISSSSLPKRQTCLPKGPAHLRSSLRWSGKCLGSRSLPPSCPPPLAVVPSLLEQGGCRRDMLVTADYWDTQLTGGRSELWGLSGEMQYDCFGKPHDGRDHCLLGSLIYSTYLEQYLAHSRYSINTH